MKMTPLPGRGRMSNDRVFCRPCTCERCRRNYTDRFCAICCFESGNTFIDDVITNSFDDLSNSSDHLYNPSTRRILDTCFNQDFDNKFSQTSPSFPQQYLCCENCGGPHETFQCQPMNQNNSSGFDQFQPPLYPVIHHPPQETSVKILQARENLMKSIQTILKKYNRISFKETPKVLSLAGEKFFEIQHAQPEDIHELLRKLLEDLQIISEELVEYINSPSWSCPTFYDDDDDEYSIQYKKYLENSSNATTPDLKWCVWLSFTEKGCVLVVHKHKGAFGCSLPKGGVVVLSLVVVATETTTIRWCSVRSAAIAAPWRCRLVVV
nr:hypothetical protein [Tanacetum cinerariifolium]